jgi:tetratricopeptide (TPR) repeat protein
MYSTPYDLALFYSKLFYSNQLLNDQSKAQMYDGYKKPTKPWSGFLADDKTQWHSYGGGPGVSAAVEILMKDRLMVIVLANTDDVVAERISQRVIEVYRGKAYKKVRAPLGLFAKNLLAKKGSVFFVGNAKQAFADAEYNDYGPRPLNKLGYALINNKQLDQAINIFLANTQIFPQDPNTFDSLASAFEKAGNNAKALLNYQKALSLDADFESAKAALLR